MKKICNLLLLSLSFYAMRAGTPAKTGDLQFIQNAGQWQSPIAYSAAVYGGELFLEKDCFTWFFSNLSEISAFKHGGNIADLQNFVIKKHAFKTHFVNANPEVSIVGENKFTNYYNYFLGNDASKWKGAVPAFGAIRYSELYPGTDMLVYSRSNNIKYDLILAPNADASQIQFTYEGLDDIRIVADNLELVTSINTVVEVKPYAYQIINGKTIPISCNFILEVNTVSFSFPNGYDKNYELIIDPATLIFASYTGSTADNWGFSATYDNDGNLYGAGLTFNDGYPITIGAFQENWSSAPGAYVGDITISKFTSDGTSLVYSTYCGGSSEDIPYSLIVNDADELILFGSTGSNNYPVTVGAYDVSFNGGSTVVVDGVLNYASGSDAIITKFNALGTALLGSTYLGGSGNDAINEGSTANNYGDPSRGEVNIDNDGNIYIASCTRSSNLPVTAGVIQNTFGGQQDGFLAKLNSNLTNLVWCTYLGGSGDDGAFSIKKIHDDKFVVCGGTRSMEFPTTPGALHETFQGGSADGFVLTLNANATSIYNSTFIGTEDYDITFLTEVDADHSIYITGQSLGPYPVIGDVYENAGSSQYITKLDSTLSTMEFSTVFGNGQNEISLVATAFLVDNCNHIYVSGWGGNVNKVFNPDAGIIDDMPITPDAFQSSTDGSDFYLCVFDAGASGLLYSTYFGGPLSAEHVDGGTSRFDKLGVVYQAVCAGCGSNDDFPTTAGVVSNINASSNCNLGVFKFAFDIPPTTAAFIADPIEGCFPLEVNFENTSINASSIEWQFGDGSVSTAENPIHTYLEPGTYTVMLVGFVDINCGINDTAFGTITVYGNPEASFSFSPDPSTVLSPTFFTDESIDAASWLWEFGDGFTSTEQNPTHLFPLPGTYQVCLTVTNAFGCTDKICDSITAIEVSLLDVPNAFSPNGDGTNDFFLPTNAGLDNYEFKIYNRWGELLFLTNDPKKGWNGVYNNIEQELDVYIYIVSGTGLDGTNYYKQGNFTLVR